MVTVRPPATPSRDRSARWLGIAGIVGGATYAIGSVWTVGMLHFFHAAAAFLPIVMAGLGPIAVTWGLRDRVLPAPSVPRTVLMAVVLGAHVAPMVAFPAIIAFRTGERDDPVVSALLVTLGVMAVTVFAFALVVHRSRLVVAGVPIVLAVGASLVVSGLLGYPPIDAGDLRLGGGVLIIGLILMGAGWIGLGRALLILDARRRGSAPT